MKINDLIRRLDALEKRMKELEGEFKESKELVRKTPITKKRK